MDDLNIYEFYTGIKLHEHIEEDAQNSRHVSIIVNIILVMDSTKQGIAILL